MTPREQAEQLIRDCEIGPQCNICKTLRALIEESAQAEAALTALRETLETILPYVRTHLRCDTWKPVRGEAYAEANSNRFLARERLMEAVQTVEAVLQGREQAP